MRTATPEPITESAVRNALRDCYHPQLRANLVELGMVESIEIAIDSHAPGSGIPGVPVRYQVGVGLLRPQDSGAEEMDVQLSALVQNRLAAFANISSTEVRSIADPVWSPERMAPELRGRIEHAIASNHRRHDLVQIQTPSSKPRSL